MSLSAGILIGLLAVIIGAALYRGTQQKKAALVVMVVGAMLALLTVGLIVLAVNSGM